MNYEFLKSLKRGGLGCLLYFGLSPLFSQTVPKSGEPQMVPKAQDVKASEHREVDSARPRPGVIAVEDLEGFEKLTPEKKKLIEEAIRVSSLGLGYVFGSADPKKSGMDCSGAIYYVLHRGGLQPPRASDAQYRWVWENQGVQSVVGQTFQSFEFSKLSPGDLLFWSGTYMTQTKRDPNITHVMLYLGKLKKTRKMVMFGASEGRSYEGIARDGVGVFEFQLPRLPQEADKTSSVRFVGYGAIPRLIDYQIQEEPKT